MPRASRLLTDSLTGAACRRPARTAWLASENNYDYAGQDPINDYDLDGTCVKHFGWACKGGHAVGHFVVQHSGTISTVTGVIALVGYGSCAFTGVGCGVGLVFSLASSSAASLNAAHACSANVKSAKCVSAAVGAAASILGTGAAAKFAKPAFQALPGRPAIFATTWATKQGGKVNFWFSFASFGAGFGAQQGLSR